MKMNNTVLRIVDTHIEALKKEQAGLAAAHGRYLEVEKELEFLSNWRENTWGEIFATAERGVINLQEIDWKAVPKQ